MPQVKAGEQTVQVDDEESSDFNEDDYILAGNISQAPESRDEIGNGKKFRSVDAYLAFEINENMFKMRGDKSVKPCKLLEP